MNSWGEILIAFMAGPEHVCKVRKPIRAIHFLGKRIYILCKLKVIFLHNSHLNKICTQDNSTVDRHSHIINNNLRHSKCNRYSADDKVEVNV